MTLPGALELDFCDICILGRLGGGGGGGGRAWPGWAHASPHRRALPRVACVPEASLLSSKNSLVLLQLQ